MINTLKASTITHELHSVNEKKALAKYADRNYKVKLTFKEGLYDDEAIVEGYKNDVSAFIGYFKNSKNVDTTPKSLTRSFPSI